MAGMRKFFGGVITGGLVAGATLVVVSQLSVPQVPGAVPEAAVEGSIAAPATPKPAVVAIAPEPAQAVEPAPEPQPPVVAETEQTAPAQVTVVEVAPDKVTTNGAAVPPVAEVLPEVDAAALPDTPPSPPQVDLPAQTLPESGEPAPVIAAEEAGSLTAQLPVPPAIPLADGAPEVAELPPPPPLTAEEVAVLADPAQLSLPVEETPPDASAEQASEPLQPVTDSAEGMAEGDAVQSPVIPAPQPDQVVIVDEPPLPEPLQVTEEEALPNPAMPEASLAEDSPSTLAPTPSLITAGEGSLIDRAAAEKAVAESENAAVLPEVALEDAPALQRFAAEFTNPDAKPLFGILLVDTGEAALNRQAVAALPFPVSIVIDPLSPEASAHAALYRAGGKEVVMLATGIPEGATPADVEQTFQAHANTLPEAVAVVDGNDPAFQNDRALSTQIVPILAAQGRGLLTWDKGLNAADQVARREGLATAMIFRQIDADGESVPVMRRYLDRAAFRAAQEGEAIVIGTMQPETIAALLEWTIEGRASTVALAPASALLSGQ